MRRRPDPFERPVITPIPGLRPPKDWAKVSVEDEMVVVRLSGWRRVLAVSQGVKVPIAAVVDVRHESAPHSVIAAKLRRSGRTRLWRLGSYHGRDGWSYWACGVGRNAIVIEASGARYRYVVVEAAEPRRLVKNLLEDTGLSARRRASVAVPPDPGAQRPVASDPEPKPDRSDT